ncbi:MAG TPA: sigma-70 family RNA polymerase sigma factor [Planctomycetota bacterium]|nr:sigma-70 family RNA polymerase sigma factor [Planctomycetota bacterium]
MAEAAGNLEALIGEHYREVHGLLWALTRNQATADELAQEVFIVALKKGMAPGDGMRLWLRETARRLAMNELRRKRPKALDTEDLAVLPGMAVSDEAGKTESFDDELSALRACLSELPEPDRKLLSERYNGGASIAELAQKTGMSVEYVKLKLFRLRKTLGERIRRKVLSPES